MLVTAHYCFPPHCTDFTDMDLTACVFWFCEHYHYFSLLLLLLLYYVSATMSWWNKDYQNNTNK